jgi:hypothetical protein
MSRLAVTSLLTMVLPIVAWPQSSFEPCGGGSDKLWSWAHAGANGEHATVINGDFGKPIVTRMTDLSGNNHDYHNTLGGVQSQFGYQVGVSASGYSTSLPIFGLSSYADGTNIWPQSLLQDGSLSAAGGFYLAFAGMNTRTAGRRWLWGTNGSHNVKLEQTDNRVEFTISGNVQNISARGSLPSGPILVEVWRDTNNRLYVMANGNDITSGSPVASGTYDISGIGGPPNHESAWDDYAFEFIACKGLPSSTERAEVREYLRSKWNLFSGQIDLPPPEVEPMPPTGLTTQ